jgi:hypothetical protein
VSNAVSLGLFAIVLLLGGCSRRGGGFVTATTAGTTFADAAATVPAVSLPFEPASAPPGLAPPAPPSCGDSGEVILFSSPEHPVRGRPLRIVAVADRPIGAAVTVLAGGASAETSERHGGPPYYWLVEIDAPEPGRWSATMARDPACGVSVLASQAGRIANAPLAKPPAPRSAIWTTRRAWSPSIENLFSAWIANLFDAPLDAQPSFSALHEVLRDRSRNFLFGHLGAEEDEQGIVIKPDCADLPYFLRAYFSFKLGLPFGWSHCSRGGNGLPPHCGDFATNEIPFPTINDKLPATPVWADPNREQSGAWENNVKRVGEFFRTTLADAAQSGAGRTPADEDDSDFYPIALSTDTLRPGTIFGDPYGHVLVVVSRIPQTDKRAGVLLAVDGQPDGTVARKRFWRGNFLFAIDPSLGSAGFKRFRSVVRDRRSGRLVRPKNADLSDYSSTDQYADGVEGFYDKMDAILSPERLDPMQALLESITALEEQVETRVVSVDNGRRFLTTGRPPADMPDGEKIFEALGDWEDFSTPSRDLRLLIAIDVARSLPSRIARQPNRYALGGQDLDRVQRALEGRLESELRSRTFTYTRSNGLPWRLSLEDVVERELSLEVAYDPNDCVEARWGAPSGSDEASTCGAHAPAEQVAKMQEYREWFHDRRRPPR